jgi:hypothetical protein
MLKPTFRRPLLAVALAFTGALASTVPAVAATDGTSNTVVFAESVARPDTGAVASLWK